MWCRAAVVGITIFALSFSAMAQTTQSATMSSDPSTPKGALKALALALDTGDGPAIRALMNVTSPMEQKMVSAISEMAVAMADLKHAMSGKYGKSAEEGAMNDAPDTLLKSLATIDAASEKIDGETATISVAPTPRGSMVLRKVNGSWKISVADQVKDQAITAQQVDEQAVMVTEKSKLLKDLTTDVTAGKYTSATDAAVALREKMMGGQAPTSAPVSTGP